MSSWRPTTPIIGMQPITETSTTQKHPLGLIIQAAHEDYGAGEFIYLLGAAATVAKAWVYYNPDDWSTTAILADGKGAIAIAMSANVASQYGWYQISGKALGLCLTGIADNGRVCLTSTSWKVDDASVTGDLIVNALCAGTTVVDSGYAEFEIERPFTTDSLSTGA